MQGELNSRKYDRTLRIPHRAKSIQHVIPLAVELKANAIRLLDRTTNSTGTCPPSANRIRQSVPAGTALKLTYLTKRYTATSFSHASRSAEYDQLSCGLSGLP